MSHRIRQRQWVRDTGSGFILVDQVQEREFSDDQAVSMALSYKKNYFQGLLKSLTRRFLVWIASPEDLPERLVLKTTILAGKPDPLEGLIRRIGNHLFELAKQDLETGQTVEGEGWTWQGRELTIRERKDTKITPMDDVAAMARVDGRLQIWRKGEDAAWAQLPEESANLYILERLLAEHLSRQPMPGPPPDGSLGRVYFERAPSRRAILILRILIVALAAASIGCGLVVGLVLRDIGPSIVLMLLFLSLAAGCGLLFASLRQKVFRCYEYGVFQAGLFGKRALRYDDVEAFTYSAVRRFYHGAYMGSTFTLQFEPRQGKGLSRIRVTFSLFNADDELDRLRDTISRLIAGRMYRQLKANEPVEWTSRLRFLPQGLEYATGWFRRRTVVIPYSDIAGNKLEQGKFYLWTKRKKKAIVREQTSRRNFFPGYFLLMAVAQGAPLNDELRRELEACDDQIDRPLLLLWPVRDHHLLDLP
jgi:hypothetical protein